MLTQRLDYQAPYDWPAQLGFLAARAIPGVESVSATRYARVFTLDGQVGSFVVEPADVQTDAPRAQLTVSFAEASALPAIVRGVRHIFDLDADPARIAVHLSRDPLLAPLVQTRPGLRVPGAWSGFELAVRAILGQQITVVAATRLAALLVSRYGQPLAQSSVLDVGLTHVFPTPERLASEDLSTLPMPRARSGSLAALARTVVERPEVLGPYPSLELAVRKLRELPGIGEWTAQYYAMRQLRETDAFLAADVALQRALAAPDGTRPTEKQLLARAVAWSPFRAYAALHLWASL